MGKNEKEIHRHLRQALRDLTPDEAEKLWNTTIEKASGQEWYLDGTGRRRKKTTAIVKTFAALAACLVLCVSFATWRTVQIYSTVYLDVNPSITLEINRKDQVVRSIAGNRDGEIVLGGMNLKNTDIDVALNAVLGSMMKNGYFGEDANVVLLSVDSKNAEKANDLSERLSDDVDLCLKEMSGENSVYYQTFSRDDSIRSLEEEYGISAGKAALLRKITDRYPQVSIRDLAGLTMNELEQYLNDYRMEEQADLGYKTNRSAVTPATSRQDPQRTEMDELEDRNEMDDRDELDDEEDDEDDRNTGSGSTNASGSIGSVGSVSRNDDDDNEDDERNIGSGSTSTAGSTNASGSIGSVGSVSGNDDDDNEEDDRSTVSGSTSIVGSTNASGSIGSAGSVSGNDDDDNDDDDEDHITGSSAVNTVSNVYAAADDDSDDDDSSSGGGSSSSGGGSSSSGGGSSSSGGDSSSSGRSSGSDEDHDDDDDDD